MYIEVTVIVTCEGAASSTFGQGIGPIHLSNLGCSGTEARLVDCATVAGRTCSHSEDAGARCLVKTGIYRASLT